METLAPDQRNDYYLIESGRAGIHKPLLAALYAVHGQPSLIDGELGLGIAPIHQVDLSQVNTFAGQVEFAANTLRSLTNHLAQQGWPPTDIWNTTAGRYADHFLTSVAKGFTPEATDPEAARLEPCDPTALRQAYLEAINYDYRGANLPKSLTPLDPALLAFAERLPAHYGYLDFQRQALVETVRLWRQFNSPAAVYEVLQISVAAQVPDEAQLDPALLDFLRSVPRDYTGLPHQREALIRLVQLWYQINSREAAIEWLLANDPFSQDTHLPIVDPALVAFVQRIPSLYRGQGDQRFALTEGYRRWFGLESRTAALQQLGINPEALVANADNQPALIETAKILDRALLNFVESLPTTYTETEPQREALIRLVQIWRRLEGRTATLQSLLADLRQLERAAATSPDAMPTPTPPPLPPRPATWTPHNLQLGASIIPNGHFTWAEATGGGVKMPTHQATVDAIVRLAHLVQQARDRLGRPLVITNWYCPSAMSPQEEGASSHRHRMGDALDFYCVGLTGNQVYWFLDPWWPGGLGRYTRFPQLVHLDARDYKARWTH